MIRLVDEHYDYCVQFIIDKLLYHCGCQNMKINYDKVTQHPFFRDVGKDILIDYRRTYIQCQTGKTNQG